jgi:hypothetical protein
VSNQHKGPVAVFFNTKRMLPPLIAGQRGRICGPCCIAERKGSRFPYSGEAQSLQVEASTVARWAHFSIYSQPLLLLVCSSRPTHNFSVRASRCRPLRRCYKQPLLDVGLSRLRSGNDRVHDCKLVAWSSCSFPPSGLSPTSVVACMDTLCGTVGRWYPYHYDDPQLTDPATFKCHGMRGGNIDWSGPRTGTRFIGRTATSRSWLAHV